MPEEPFDEDGLREVAWVAASDTVRRNREQVARASVRTKQDDLRTAFAAGKMTMAEYAKAAREAGITAKEVGAALQERAAAEKRMEQKSVASKEMAESAHRSAEQPADLAAAHAAKAQGLERLKRGEVADAAEAFEDAASLAARAAEAVAAAAHNDAHSATIKAANEVRCASLLNAALCHLKLADWPAAEAACTTVLEKDPTSAKAFYRRGTARLRLARAAEAAEDLADAATHMPSDKVACAGPRPATVESCGW